MDFHCKPGHTAAELLTNPDDLAVKTKAAAALPALGGENTNGEGSMKSHYQAIPVTIEE